MTLRIGPLTLDPPVVLAPMAGVTTRAFRRLCRQFGPGGLYVSEMLTARALVEGNERTARMLRFERTSTMLEQQPTAAVAAVAAACGYYDQAHMANEWRSMAGMSISQWRAVELRDPPIDTVAV